MKNVLKRSENAKNKYGRIRNEEGFMNFKNLKLQLNDYLKKLKDSRKNHDNSLTSDTTPS